MRRPITRAVVGFALAAVLGALFVGWVGPHALLAELGRADLEVFALGLLAAAAALLAWSEMLGRLLGVRRGYRLAYLAGDFGKQVLPMGHASGPALMAYAVSRTLGMEYERGLAVVTVSEALHLTASLGVAAAGLAVLATTGQAGLAPVAAIVSAALLAVATVFALVWFRRETIEGGAQAAARVLQGRFGVLDGRLGAALTPAAVAARLERYYATLSSVTAGDSVATAALLAVAGWCCYVAPLYTSALALGHTLPVGLVLLAVPLAGLATWLPVPGGIGGVEAALAGLLVAFGGFDLGAAAAVAVLYRLCAYWFVVLVEGAAATAVVTR